MYAIGTRHRALCSDGKTRSALVTNWPDTFSTVPARVKVHGKTVTGFIWSDRCETLRFTANRWMRNANLLPVKER